MKKQNNWTGFYENRINSGYQDYFEERYKPLLLLLKPYSHIFEEGCGIGSVSKAMLKEGKVCFGYDSDIGMTKLCKLNNPYMGVGLFDIFSDHKIKYHKNECVVTHGVIEHFSDDQILSIFKRYEKSDVDNIHYVPTDGYEEPSFGDERLLPYEYWLDLVQPKDYLLFNDNKDLLIINTK